MVKLFMPNARECLRRETVEGRSTSRGRGVFEDGAVGAGGEAANGAMEWSGRRERRRRVKVDRRVREAKGRDGLSDQCVDRRD